MLFARRKRLSRNTTTYGQQQVKIPKEFFKVFVRMLFRGRQNKCINILHILETFRYFVGK